MNNSKSYSGISINVGLLIACIFLVEVVVGQNGWTIYNHSNSSLPQNTIRCLYVDSVNQKWIGTDFGLAVYNDTAFTIYNVSNSGLPDNSVRSIQCDSVAAMWIGTQNGGVAKFFGGTWTVYNSSNSPMTSDFVKSIAIDTSGAKWFGTSDGLYRFDDSAWEIYNADSGLLSTNINTVCITKNNMKCIGTLNGGLVNMTDTGMQFFNHVIGNLPDNTVFHITTDTADTRWFAMPAGGFMAHYEGGLTQLFNTSNSNIPTNALNYVYADSGGRKLIGSQDYGMLLFNYPNFTFLDSSNSPLPESNVLCIARDHLGMYWIGTSQNGLVKWDGSIPVVDGIPTSEINKPIAFPNPSTGKLYVQLKSSYSNSPISILIQSILGNNVLELENVSCEASSTRIIPFDLSSLSKGVYIIRVRSENETITQKLILQ